MPVHIDSIPRDWLGARAMRQILTCPHCGLQTTSAGLSSHLKGSGPCAKVAAAAAERGTHEETKRTHVENVGQRGRTVNTTRVSCPHCGLQTTPGPLACHLKRGCTGGRRAETAPVTKRAGATP
jgi:hypothetical protein